MARSSPASTASPRCWERDKRVSGSSMASALPWTEIEGWCSWNPTTYPSLFRVGAFSHLEAGVSVRILGLAGYYLGPGFGEDEGFFRLSPGYGGIPGESLAHPYLLPRRRGRYDLARSVTRHAALVV